MNQNQVRAAYYHLYPFEVVFDWLSATEKTAGIIGAREYAFRFDSLAMKRFQNFANAEEFKKAVKKANPAEIHLGGIFVCKPCQIFQSVLTFKK
jgi:DNA primase catalytic subunit